MLSLLIYPEYRNYRMRRALRAEYFCFLYPDPSFLSASRLVYDLVP